MDELTLDQSEISMSFVVPDEAPSGDSAGYVSGLSLESYEDEEQDENDVELNKLRIARSQSPDMEWVALMKERALLDTCNRLYLNGVEKATKRAIALREKLQKDQSQQTLRLATTRSYTPTKPRKSSENIHNRLYQLSKVNDDKKKQENDASSSNNIVKLTPKRAEEVLDRLYGRSAQKQEEGKQKREMIQQKSDGKELNECTDNNFVPSNVVKMSPKRVDEVLDRLYSRSAQKQEEGRKRRERIQKRMTPRAPTPSKRISLSHATDMYDRGLNYKTRVSQKIDYITNASRESLCPKMKNQIKSSSTGKIRPKASIGKHERCSTPLKMRLL